MCQQSISRVSLNLLTLSCHHQSSQLVNGFLLQILVQYPHRDSCLLVDQIDQLVLVVGSYISRYVFTAHITNHVALILGGEGLHIGINVGITTKLVANILHSIDVILHLESTILHDRGIAQEVIPVLLIHVWIVD